MSRFDHAEPTLDERFPRRATRWQLRGTTLTFGRRPKIMGIVNVTPDSFSDGGRFLSTGRAVDHALKLAAEGADVLDIGGESTRPYATGVSLDEELRRVIPVVEQLACQTDVPVSIDTSKAEVAEQAIAAGARIINDVTGLEGDPGMIDAAIQSRAGICAMHMQGTPQTMQDDPRYDDVVKDIFDYLRQRRDWLTERGIPRQRICLDPGIGFGKTHQHNLTLVAGAGCFHELSCPILVGHSRKGFLAKLIQDKHADRVPATIGVAMTLARKGVQIVRVHDVLPVRQALQLFEATGGIDGREASIDH